MRNSATTIAIIITSVIVFESCKKTSAPDTGTPTAPVVIGTGVGTGPGGAIVAGTDPAIAATQGFFLNNWSAKTFTVPTNAVSTTKPSGSGSNAVSVVVDLSQIITKVSTNLYGNNTNPYMGQYVTDAVLMNNLKGLNPHILRAPGGSLSDVYFWNGDGNGNLAAPVDAPANLLNNAGASSTAYYWFGNNTQSWTFSLANYYSVLQQTNSKGLITVNYGYARYGTSPHPDQVAAHLAANWVRYDAGRTQYWEVGNENYGNWEAGYRIDQTQNKDGQPAVITGTLYGTHFKVFADSMRKAAAEVGNTNIKIGIVLSTLNDANNNAGVSNWNSGVLAAAGNYPDFFVVHNYYTPYAQNSDAATILGTSAPQTTQMMQWIKTSVQNAGVIQKPVALDEWNIQAIGSDQAVSNVAGVHAAMVMGEALKNQISLACRWDLANGWGNGDDQGIFNLGDEPGTVAMWNPRPAFYYLNFFQTYFGDRMVSSTSSSPYIVSYGSSFSSGQAGVVLINQGSVAQVVNVAFNNFNIGTNYYYYTLSGGTDNAPFSRQVFVNGVGPSNGISGGPSNYAAIPAKSAAVSGGITVSIPANSAVFLVADK